MVIARRDTNDVLRCRIGQVTELKLQDLPNFKSSVGLKPDSTSAQVGAQGWTRCRAAVDVDDEYGQAGRIPSVLPPFACKRSLIVRYWFDRGHNPNFIGSAEQSFRCTELHFRSSAGNGSRG